MSIVTGTINETEQAGEKFVDHSIAAVLAAIRQGNFVLVCRVQFDATGPVIRVTLEDRQ